MRRRITTLLVVGAALLAAGAYSVVTTFGGLFARYMYVEDLELGLGEETIFAVTRITPFERGVIIVGVVLALLGIAALISAAVRHRGEMRRHANVV